MNPSDPKRAHTLADHLLGALSDHTHGDCEHDHDHDHDPMEGLLPPGAGAEVALTSIGIDVGSSGTQVAFSRLFLERSRDRNELAGGGGQEARLEAAQRQTLYQSPVSLTPYAHGATIDIVALDGIVDRAFAGARLSPDDVDCGVVILTGAARLRENAAAITARLAESCGDIVSASAGHHMEARLAAYGSGAVQRSAQTGKRFLNVDIGGATTKLAVCAAGEVTATAALDIGGRLVVTDLEGHITRLDPAGLTHAARAGLDWRLGTVAVTGEIDHVATGMAEALVAVLTQPRPPREIAALYLTEPIGALDGIDGLIVSGGVGEYVYGREKRDFCDFGRALGRALVSRIDGGALPWPLMPAAECIRATVLGASAWSVQLSGRTGFVSDPARLLPRRNLQVLQPRLDLGGDIDAAAVAELIMAHLTAFDLPDGGEEIVLALRWRGLPEYPRLRALAEGIRGGLANLIEAGTALRIVVDGDIARSLGAILKDDLGLQNELLVLDGIALADLDFVDLGRIRLPSETVPVTIKSLVFRDQPVQKHGRERTGRNRAKGRR